MTEVTKLPCLMELVLVGVIALTRAGLIQLADLPKLEFLDLRGSCMIMSRSEVVRCFPQLPNLIIRLSSD
jgi:hypothetical protein